MALPSLMPPGRRQKRRTGRLLEEASAAAWLPEAWSGEAWQGRDWWVVPGLGPLEVLAVAAWLPEEDLAVVLLEVA